MPYEILRQTNFNGGELSPQAVGRRDLKAYASSLALCENMLPMAEGPVRRRPGMPHIDVVRNKLTGVVITEAMLSSPNGGYPGRLITGGGFETHNDMAAIDGYVLLELDFGEPTEIGLVDLIDFVIKPPSVGQGGGGGGGGGGGVLDPLPDPPPPQYPWDREFVREIV